MANATSVTLNVLTENVAKDDVVESVLDTGTAAVTIPLTPDGDTHNILLKFENNAAAADIMTVEILAGDNPPAFQAGLGNLSIALAQNEIDYAVIESARFMQSDGTISVKSTPAASKTQTLKITAIKLPK